VVNTIKQFVDKVKNIQKEIFCIVAPMFQSDKTKTRPSGSGRVPGTIGIHALRCPPPPSLASALPPPSVLLSFVAALSQVTPYTKYLLYKSLSTVCLIVVNTIKVLLKLRMEFLTCRRKSLVLTTGQTTMCGKLLPFYVPLYIKSLTYSTKKRGKTPPFLDLFSFLLVVQVGQCRCQEHLLFRLR